MADAGKSLCKEVHHTIKGSVKETLKMLTGEKEWDDLLLSKLTLEQVESLKKLQLTSIQICALGKVLTSMEESSFFHFMCIIDSVADTQEELPDLAIVDRETREDIFNQFLHDEFFEVFEDLEEPGDF